MDLRAYESEDSAWLDMAEERERERIWEKRKRRRRRNVGRKENSDWDLKDERDVIFIQKGLDESELPFLVRKEKPLACLTCFLFYFLF